MNLVKKSLDFCMNTWVALIVLLTLIAFLAHGVYQEYQLQYVHPELKWQVPAEAIEKSEQVIENAVKSAPIPPVSKAMPAEPKKVVKENTVSAYAKFIRQDNPKVKQDTAQEWANLYYDFEEQYGLKHGIMPAIGHVESGHKPNAKSKKDAHGLVQIQRETGRYWADREGIRHQSKVRKAKSEKDLIWVISKPDVNIRLGAKVLDVYLQEAGGNLDEALKRYSGGATDYAKKVRSAHRKIVSAIDGNI